MRRNGSAALERYVFDLSGTEWAEWPDYEVVNAAIFVARGSVNDYPDPSAARVRRLVAERHGLEPQQVVLGNGAGELMQTAALALLSRGDELVTPWPSYPLYPLMARRAGAQPVPVALRDGRVDAEALLAAVGDRTRVLAICNPNDPTGTYLESDLVAELLSRLPGHVHVLLDEALVHFQDREHEDACLRLVECFPRLVVFRSFSNAYGLSGLRAGYAVGSEEAAFCVSLKSAPAIDRLLAVLGGITATSNGHAPPYGARPAASVAGRAPLVHAGKRRFVSGLASAMPCRPP